MLVLERRIGQSIHIGNQIKVFFLKQKNGRFKVGIEAPEEIVIVRSEIMDKYSFLHKK